ncbi:MAG TPA: hypothetical protein VLI42_07660 [Chthoniobacterales bacterium]|nr:hypothetical protein [Chthoniobacterales bacterium]
MRSYLVVFSVSIVCLLCLRSSEGQMAAPVIIQAATPAPAGVVKPDGPPTLETGAQSTVQLLQEMQAANAATIKKQEAALATLDELQKAAEELKIFSKRG